MGWKSFERPASLFSAKRGSAKCGRVTFRPPYIYNTECLRLGEKAAAFPGKNTNKVRFAIKTSQIRPARAAWLYRRLHKNDDLHYFVVPLQFNGMRRFPSVGTCALFGFVLPHRETISAPDAVCFFQHNFSEQGFRYSFFPKRIPTDLWPRK